MSPISVKSKPPLVTSLIRLINNYEAYPKLMDGRSGEVGPLRKTALANGVRKPSTDVSRKSLVETSPPSLALPPYFGLG
jgi:hypothetical protein